MYACIIASEGHHKWLVSSALHAHACDVSTGGASTALKTDHNCMRCVQHEVGVRNLEILENTTDARGRKLEVVKLHCPPPLFRTYKEAAGVAVRSLPLLSVCLGPLSSCFRHVRWS